LAWMCSTVDRYSLLVIINIIVIIIITIVSDVARIVVRRGKD